LGLDSKKTRLWVMKKELWMNEWINEWMNDALGVGCRFCTYYYEWEKKEVFGDLGRSGVGSSMGVEFLGFANPTSMPNWVSRVHPRDLWFFFFLIIFFRVVL
jgi:hypothetical protein